MSSEKISDEEIENYTDCGYSTTIQKLASALQSSRRKMKQCEEALEDIKEGWPYTLLIAKADKALAALRSEDK